MKPYFNPDSILNFINTKNNFINNILLKLNLFPSIVYGIKYLKAKKEIGLNKDYEFKLINYVNNAISSTKYYSQYNEIRDIDDFFKNIGFIDKKVVLNNFGDFMVNSFDKSKFIYGTTSGTSGRPMKLYLPRNRYYYELSAVHSIWCDHGWNYETRAVIRNHKLSENRIYSIKPLTKEIIFDAFRLDVKYVKEIYRVLKRKRIKYIQAYPSSAYLFCKICADLELELSFIKCIFTSSEPLLDYQREFIENKSNIRISNFYGHSEKLIIAGDNKKSSDLIFEDFYGYVELIDENGNQICKKGQVGELVGTGFHNTGLFLIRYKTGDFAEYVSNYCQVRQKKGLVVKNIVGHRNKNIIFKSDGTYITTTALNLHGALYDKIDGIQYVQVEKGSLVVKLIKNIAFNDNDLMDFQNHFKYAMGKDSKVYIEFVEKLEYHENGKYSILISDLI